MSDPFWFDPRKVRFKISPIEDLKEKQGGDWDLNRRYDLASTLKYQAIVQRFSEGRRWEETDLFCDIYTRRFERGDEVRGAASIEELAAQYYDRIDSLYQSMKRKGFRVRGYDRRRHPLPVILIGRDGDVFIGNQGNHRLAIAHVLGLGRMAGKVICRHQ